MLWSSYFIPLYNKTVFFLLLNSVWFFFNHLQLLLLLWNIEEGNQSVPDLASVTAAVKSYFLHWSLTEDSIKKKKKRKESQYINDDTVRFLCCTERQLQLQRVILPLSCFRSFLKALSRRLKNYWDLRCEWVRSSESFMRFRKSCDYW